MRFRAAYAAASLSCTIGPFLAIVVASMRAGSTGEGLAAAGQVQHSLSAALSAAGVEMVAVVFALLLATAVTARRLISRSGRDRSEVA